MTNEKEAKIFAEIDGLEYWAGVFSQGRYKSRIKKLAVDRPEECRIVAENTDGSLCAHIPVAWIKITPPKQFTEEQRRQMGGRLNGNGQK